MIRDKRLRGESAELTTLVPLQCGGDPLPFSRPVLCAERVVRITKTYHDIDAVTNLLDEVC